MLADFTEIFVYRNFASCRVRFRDGRLWTEKTTTPDEAPSD